MTTLSIRIEEKTKKAAQKTLEAVGLDLSSAVKMFLNQVVVEQGIPFKPSRNPQEIKARWDKEVALTLKSGKRYSSTEIEQMFNDILKK
jgi:DNA-damage-inducible protein J